MHRYAVGRFRLGGWDNYRDNYRDNYYENHGILESEVEAEAALESTASASLFNAIHFRSTIYL